MRQVVHDESLEFLFRAMGYERGNEIIDIDEKLMDILDILKGLSIKGHRGIKYPKRELINTSRMLLDNIFDIHDVSVVSEKELYSLSLKNDKCDSSKNLDYIANVSQVVSPYDIPIYYSYESMISRCFSEKLVYFCSVFINKKDMKNAVPTYIHELVHTQLDSQKGIVSNYHNTEIFSIFIEILSSQMLDSTGKLLRHVQQRRYKNLSECIQYLTRSKNGSRDELEASMYIVSTLKAEHLFEKYMNSDNKMKEEILLGIQKVFDGSETVEDYLNRYNISYENSKDKRLIRRQLNI